MAAVLDSYSLFSNPADVSGYFDASSPTAGSSAYGRGLFGTVSTGVSPMATSEHVFTFDAFDYLAFAPAPAPAPAPSAPVLAFDAPAAASAAFCVPSDASPQDSDQETDADVKPVVDVPTRRASKRKRAESQDDYWSDYSARDASPVSSRDAASEQHPALHDPNAQRLLQARPSQLSADEQRERKRLKNRIAAHESRQRRKEANDKERSEYDLLRSENLELRQTVHEMQVQMAELALKLDFYQRGNGVEAGQPPTKRRRLA
eukprot:c32388_g1_i1.p1 GENE.c32388_g1_i1~~c32388_g1_i1.p1  ORF type:complete len:261 (+),score=30.18 c32388_g1_i1:160-942(+)